jgi:hypothetical protein
MWYPALFASGATQGVRVARRIHRVKPVGNVVAGGEIALHMPRRGMDVVRGEWSTGMENPEGRLNG